MAKQRSIQRRLIGIIMLTSTVSLLVACLAFIFIDLAHMREMMVRDLGSLARNIDYNSTAPLLFDDQDGEREVMDSIRTHAPNVVSAAVFDAEGNLFANYQREPDSSWQTPAVPGQGTYDFTSKDLNYFHQIIWEGDRLGTVYLQSDLSELVSRLKRYAAIVAAVILACFLITYFLSAALQRSISQPIRRLAEIMNSVSEQKDFSIRADISHRDDEVGSLVAGFNDMLRRVEQRDQELLDYRESLEDTVDARTAELRRVNVELETATQHKSEFLANMSHELRTPLNAIIGFSEVLQQKMFGELNDKQDEYVDDILTSGRHLLSLINDILDLSKIEAGRMELHLREFDFGAAVENASLLVREKAMRHNLTLSVEVDADVGEIVADERKVKQVLLNLLSNAVKFTPDGGKITVSASRRGEQAEVRVTDTGVGISQEDQASVFDEFQQVGSDDRKQEGTGLGLALAKRFVDLHGGSISVVSAAGSGTTFTFTLPLVTKTLEAQSAVASIEPEPADPASTLDSSPFDAKREGAPTVLVIEDDPATAKLLAIHLNEAGFRVELAGNAAEGLRMARSLRPDAITLDLLLPDADGWSVLERLKADSNTARIPIIVVSLLEDSGQGFSLGASEYLMKPVDPAELLGAIRRCVGEDASVDGSALALIIDEDSTGLEWMHSILQREGFEVVTSNGGVDGLAQIWRRRPDLVVLDLLMSGAGGIELIEQLNNNPETSKIPIVALAADLGPEDQDLFQGQIKRLAGRQSFDQDTFVTLTKSLLKSENERWQTS